MNGVRDGAVRPDAPDAPGAAARLRATASRLALDGPAPGASWCAAWSDEVDATLRALHAQLGDVGVRGTALLAVGGYGRRELCPASDIDLLILHAGLEATTLEAVVRSVVYPLWDVGLTVGYAVRSRREAVAAVDEVDAATAVLDGRLLAGDAGLAAQVRSEVSRRLTRRPQRFLEQLLRSDEARHAAASTPTETLEPDLKLGAGGLRDLQSMRWAAAALVGANGLEPLVPAGFLSAADLPRLRRAGEGLLAARVALHLARAERHGHLDAPARQPTKDDTVRFELQEQVAARLGYDDAGPSELAPHRLLRELALDARTIAHAHRRAWALIRADLERGRRRRTRPVEQRIDAFELSDGVLHVTDDVDLDAPDLPVRLLEVLADTGAILDRRSAGRLRSHAAQQGADGADGEGPDGELPRSLDGAGGERFVRVLWRGTPALAAVAELDDAGVLSALLPEWEPTRGRTQRNPYHRFTLDRHGWHAAAELAELVRREAWAAETLERVTDRDGLMLAAMLHDVGKAFGEPHAQTGVAPARALAGRLGARPSSIDLVERLIRLHLLLPDTARRRDLADPALAVEVAEQVADPSTLACLHLLAVADGRATGPTAWSDWTASLVTTLVRKVATVLDERSPDSLADEAVATARAAQELAEELGSTPDAVRSHLAQLSARYAAAVTPRAVVRHTLMTASAPEVGELRTRVTPGTKDPDGVDGVDELDVVALDAPGWFAKVAGVLALHGGSILAADAFARTDGIAVDTFRVQRPAGATGSWWARVEGDLVDAAIGRLAVRARVARKARADAPRPGRLPDLPTTVTYGEDASGRSTVVEVHTVDRIGVLYAITSAIAELELDIVVARVQTIGHEVTDVFYVRDRREVPLDDDQRDELVLAITSALEDLPR
jgi:[protein-PII] uridylyltransferase